MRKLGQSGGMMVQVAILLVVVLVVGGVAAFMLLQPAVVRNATAVMRVHDAYTIDVAELVDNVLIQQGYEAASSYGITVTGTVTVNSFSATNVTGQLHNKSTGEWITVVEGQTITDMTTANDFPCDISAGTYDKVKVYVGTITVDVEWTEITVDYLGFNVWTEPAGSENTSFTINQWFEISLEEEVTVNAGDNQIFDVDTGAPISMDATSSGEAQGYSFSAGEMEQGNMNARCLKMFSQDPWNL